MAAHGHRADPHRARPGRRDPARAAHRRHRRLRLRQDHDDPGIAGAGNRGVYGGPAAAGACDLDRPRGRRARPHRRLDADRHQCALDARHVFGGDGYAAPRVRRYGCGEGAGVQARRLLVQHRFAALPAVRRHRARGPGHPVPARCDDPLSELRGAALPSGGRCGASGDAGPPAGVDDAADAGVERGRGAGGVRPEEGCGAGSRVVHVG